MAACGRGPGSAPASPDASTPDAGTDDDRDDYEVRALYDLDALQDQRTVELTVASDDIAPVADGRFVRSIRYGYVGGSGFPLPESQIGQEAVLFVEVDAGGTPVAEVSGLAVLLASSDQVPPGYGSECALQTAVPCVLAGSVLSPGQLAPYYPSEYGAPGDVIQDSNQLFLNLMLEMRRGTDVRGDPLPDPPVRRDYVTHIAEHGMRAITAAQKLVVDRGLAPSAPGRVVVGGHSKWGAASAQIAAVDARVAGAVTFGFALDWLRFVEIADDAWRGELGIDLMTSLCGGEKPCGWASISDFRRFFAATRDDPEDCGAGPCFGTGEDWVRQIDLATLLAGGWLDGKPFALVRNGREAHPVSGERPSFERGVWPEQFLFVPTSGHSLAREEHQTMWRHWVRHVLSGAPTLAISDLTVTASADSIAVTATVTGATVVSAELWWRPSSDGEFGALDGFPDYQPSHSWSTVPVIMNDVVASASTPRDSSLDYALVLSVAFDDGSGDVSVASSAVKIVNRD